MFIPHYGCASKEIILYFSLLLFIFLIYVEWGRRKERREGLEKKRERGHEERKKGRVGKKERERGHEERWRDKEREK